MKKIITYIVFFAASGLIYRPAIAQPTSLSHIPDHAVQIRENVYSLGESRDPATGKIAQGYLIVHPRVSKAKPAGAGGGGSASCYGYIASGAKWKGTPESWVVNTSNPDGIPGATIFNLLNAGINKWEGAADGNINNGSFVDILGNGTTTTGILSADEQAMDNQNEVYFDNLGDSGTIGVTIVWGIFSGAPHNRQLLEWDQVYNIQYTWATDSSVDKMDFESIATHELGHSVGMADLYQSGCSQETMYGYGSEGEIYARTLNPGDIAGINKLY